MSKNTKKILFIGNTAWSMYNFRREVFSAFLQKDYQVAVCAPYDKVFSEKLKDLGCDFYDIKLAAKGVNPVEDILLTFRFIMLFLRVKPDFIFCYTIKPNIYGSIAAFLTRIPSIAITTGLGYTFLSKNLISWISKKLYKFAFLFPRKVWFLNRDDQDIFLSEKLVTVHKAEILNSEGINLDDFKPLENASANTGCVSFLLMARLLWDKGVGEFVEAAKILKNKYPATRFSLLGFLGSNNPSAIPEEKLQEWVDNNYVEYLGTTEDVRSYIAKSDCVVLPSYYREGIPRSLMEGAAMGKILITTDSVGCKDTVDDQVSGFLCKVRDVESLTACMEKVILMSPEERSGMGLAGRKKMAREFDMKYIINRYMDVLDSCKF
ncbi:MAG: glycosyltransferase family 4 protein [Lentisphaeria bacterium]|nr:glycosyltransferase family 4 protein [Lentisphaeria bacterium]